MQSRATLLGTGTSQGVPLIGCKCEVCVSSNVKDKRLRSSVHLQIGDKSFVIDSGPDFRQQMLRAKILKLDALIFTHAHKDHIAGFDDIRAYNYIHQRPLDVYLDHRVEDALRREFPYVFDDFKYPGVPEGNFNRIGTNPFETHGVKFIPIEVQHYRLPVLGFRVGDFSYITDANFIAEKEFEKIKGSKYLVLNALRKEKHVSHFSLDEAIEVAQKAGAEQTFFTHISHQLGLHDEISKILPKNIFLGFDGLELNW